MNKPANYIDTAKIRDIPYQQEILRKGIHLISLSIPIGYSMLPKSTALSILVPLFVVFLIFDILGKHNQTVHAFINKYFGKMMRPHEVNKWYTLNGATWVLMSACLTIAVFPKLLAVTGFSILIISDIAAALIGRKFGKNKLFTKSWEGTFAFFVSAFLVITIIGNIIQAPWTYFVFGYLGSIAAGFAEAASAVLKVDDNFSIPVSLGIVMWLGAFYAASINMPYLQLM